MEDLRIRRLVLNEVGVFKHLDVSFPPCPAEGKAEIHIFVGENGTGKTTLLEAMTYFDRVHNKSLIESQSQNGKHVSGLELKTKSLKFKGRDAIQMFFAEPSWNFNSDSSSLNFVIYLKKYYHDEAGLSATHVESPPHYGFFAYNGHRHQDYAGVTAFKQLDFEPVLEALTFEKTHLNSNIFQWIMNEKTKAAFAFQKNNQEESEKYLFAIRKIENAVSKIIGRKMAFTIDESSLQVKVMLQDEVIDFRSLPDGYMSVISWLSDLLFRLEFMSESAREHFTLFLDEIDIHLHPKAQREILPAIQKLFPNAQIFITTHSPFVIGSVDDAWVYKFKLDEEGNSVLDGGEPMRSEDGHSYRWQLRSFFDTSEQFGIEVEKNLKLFYEERDRLLQNGKTKDRSTFIGIGNELLKNDSIELAQIVHYEMNQVEKILGAKK